MAASLSRPRWLASHLVVAFLGGALVIAAAGLGLATTASAVLDAAALMPRLLGASLVYIPAVWVTAAVAVLLYGLVPGATVLVWVVVLYSYVVGYLGTLLQFPRVDEQVDAVRIRASAPGRLWSGCRC
ncbi:hypothetical protein BH23ACT5_BH23ACT5_11250 [soil metagenome]